MTIISLKSFYILRAKVCRVWHLSTKLSSTFAVTEGSSCQTRGCGHIFPSPTRHNAEDAELQSILAEYSDIYNVLASTKTVGGHKTKPICHKNEICSDTFKYHFSVNRICKFFLCFNPLSPREQAE